VPIRKGRRVVAVVTVFNVGGNKYRLLTLVNYGRDGRGRGRAHARRVRQGRVEAAIRM